MSEMDITAAWTNLVHAIREHYPEFDEAYDPQLAEFQKGLQEDNIKTMQRRVEMCIDNIRHTSEDLQRPPQTIILGPNHSIEVGGGSTEKKE